MRNRSRANNNSDSDISPVKENNNKARKLKVNKISLKKYLKHLGKIPISSMRIIVEILFNDCCVRT